MDKHILQGHAAVFLANTIFGLGVPVTALLLAQWVTPMGYMLTRCVGAAIIFWIISLFTPKEKVAGRDLVVIIVGGLLGFVISQTLTAWALVYTTPVYYSLIATLTPVATMALSAMVLHEEINGRGMAGLLLGIAGAILLVVKNATSGTGKNDLFGIVLTLLSLLTWVIYLIVTRKVSTRYSAVTQMKWVFLASSVAVLPFAFPELGQQKLYSSACEWTGIAEMVFIVVFATVAGYFAIPFAMRYLSATTVSIYTNLQPVVASVIAICIGQDTLTWDKPVSGILVLLSAWIVTQNVVKR